jgi:cell division protein FtsI/penicillin-binding protein 2
MPGKRGAIHDTEGDLLASDITTMLISINPSKIDTKREPQMLKLLNNLSQTTVYLQNAYLENPLPNTYIPITTIFVLMNPKQQNELNSYPGLQTTPYASRLYSGMIKNTEYDEHDTKIYSSSDYHGISGFEKQYDSKLSGYNGGTLSLTNAKGTIIRTLISRQPKDGQDIIIPPVKK